MYFLEVKSTAHPPIIGAMGCTQKTFTDISENTQKTLGEHSDNTQKTLRDTQIHSENT